MPQTLLLAHGCSFFTTENLPMPRLSHHLHALEFGAVVLIVLSLVLFWLGQLRIDNFKENQATLVNITMMGVTNQVNGLVRNNQQHLELFIENHTKDLQQLADNSNDRNLYTQLHHKIQTFFPMALAFTLTDRQGQTLTVDFNSYTDEMCLNDLSGLDKHQDKLNRFLIKIHPNPLGYHYNIGTLWSSGSKSGILLINQRPIEFIQLLRNVQLPDYELMLVDRRQQDLIELTAYGSRNNLPLDQFHLTDRDKQRIVASHQLENTHWHLLMLHKRGLYEDHTETVWNQSLLIFFLFTAVIVLMSWWSDKLDNKRHEAVRALQRNEARFRAIVQDQTDLVCRYTAHGILTFVNHAYCRYFVKTREELLGESFKTDVLSKDQGYLSQQIDSLTPQQPIILAEYRVRLQNGRIHWQQWAIRGLYEGETLREIQAVGRDISEQKQVADKLEKAKEAAETAVISKSEFLSKMSHEIRTPMNGIIGMTELLLNTHLDTKQQDYALTVSRSATSLLNLMDDILDFARLDSGQLNLTQNNIELKQLVSDIHQTLHLKAEHKKLKLNMEFAHNLPTRIYTDAARLRQVLVNLTANAIKFTERGHVTIKISLAKNKSLNNPEVSVLFEIEDTGTGIPKQYLNHIFTEFNGIEQNNKHLNGTGLGLSISYRLIKLMRGTLQVHNREEQGSCFYFSLPFHIAPTRIEASKAASQRTSIIDTRILLVDDNPVDRQLFSEQLQNLHVRYDVVSNAETALHYLRNAYDAHDPYWLILIDYRMPMLNGHQLGVKIRQNLQYDNLCLFLISYAIESHDIERFKQLGFSGFLQKPIQHSQLHYSLEILRAAYLPNCTPPAWQDFYLQHDDKQVLSDNSYEDLPDYSQVQILLVEDNEINRTVASNMIQQLGCQLDIAVNGRIGVEKWQAKPYDLIFMDIQMPEMDGLTATAKIRELEKQQDSSKVPIVAVTANALPGDAKRCYEVGMNEVIAKPFGFDDIFTAIDKFCTIKKAQNMDTLTASASPAIVATKPKLSAPDISPNLQATNIPAPQKDLPVFDAPQLQRVVIGNINLLQKIVEVFQEDTEEQLKKLEQTLALVDENDIEQQRHIERMMHSLKGEARNIGALQMGEFAYEGELAAKAQQWQRAQAVLPYLKQSFTQLQKIWADIDWNNFLE